MITEKHQENIKKFVCVICDFSCCKKGDYNRHITTSKHLKIIEMVNNGKKKHQNQKLFKYTNVHVEKNINFYLVYQDIKNIVIKWRKLNHQITKKKTMNWIK